MEEEVKVNLIGAINPAKLTPDESLIEIKNRKLEWPKAVCYCICGGCGQISEISLVYAKGLLRTMSMLENLPNVILEKKEDFKNYYFKISYCENCDPGKLSVELKELKRS